MKCQKKQTLPDNLLHHFIDVHHLFKQLSKFFPTVFLDKHKANNIRT